MQAVIASLPAPIRARLREIAISYEPVPTSAMIKSGVDPELLGLFVGHEYQEGDEHPEIRQILLFVENIWKEADHDLTEYRVQVRLTLLHEIGHYLGLDEDELGIRGLE